MRPKNAPLQRSLSILRCLQRGPASRAELADFVGVDLDPSAYEDIEQKAGQKRIENDIERLSELGVEIEHKAGQYHLLSYGEFSPVSLTEADLNTVAFLSETFSPGAPNSNDVQQLLSQLTDWLPTNQRDSIAMRRQRLRIDLRRKDDDLIDPSVQAAIERALNQHRLLRFSYRSPGQADGLPRLHTVQPWQLYFDSVRHHLYLDAYRLQVEGPYGVWKKEQWQAYRLGRILSDGIEVLPDKFASTPPKRPRHRLEYLLAPDIARLREITRHFDDMQIDLPAADGWVRVTGTTNDLFSAVRLLLGYGPNCKVIGGPEARREIEVIVEALGKLYAM